MKLLFAKNRRSLIVFLMLFSVMLAVLGVSGWNTNQVLNAYTGARTQFDLARVTKYRAIEDADYLAANLSEFRKLSDRGVIGVVDRIIWVEAFEGIRQRMALADFYYDIGSPVGVTVRDGHNTSLRVVTIDLRIGFPHDEALFQFFGLLEDSVNVSYEITQLEIDRVSNDASRQNTGSPPSANLMATSQINWFSIIPPSNDMPGNVQGT